MNACHGPRDRGDSLRWGDRVNWILSLGNRNEVRDGSNGGVRREVMVQCRVAAGWSGTMRSSYEDTVA